MWCNTSSYTGLFSLFRIELQFLPLTPSPGNDLTPQPLSQFRKAADQWRHQSSTGLIPWPTTHLLKEFRMPHVFSVFKIYLVTKYLWHMRLKNQRWTFCENLWRRPDLQQPIICAKLSNLSVCSRRPRPGLLSLLCGAFTASARASDINGTASVSNKHFSLLYGAFSINYYK